MGISMDNMIKVNSDENGDTKPDSLRSAIREQKAKGRKPFYVGATAGSTVLGAYDPFDALADVCQDENVWMHIHGTWGGAALLSNKQKNLMKGANRADSFCWNPHKMLGIPLQCSIVLSKVEGSFMAANSYKADYLFQPDKNNAKADLGNRTL